MATTTGASATIDSDRPPPLPLDSIPIIDLSLLSQSELFSLSMCSNSSFDLNRRDDVVIPKIDRSVFNESAGSRKQTYSRLRLAPAQSSTSTETNIHRRTPRLRLSHTPTPSNINDAEQAENSQIIRMLKELFKSDHNFEELVPIEVEIDTNVAVPELLNPGTNRKRGRPRRDDDAVFIHPPDAKRMCNNTVKKVVAHDAAGDIEMVNSRGVKVNLENLGRLEDPYGLEIRKRTEGMSTKDELLGFLGGLNGEWGTSTKKRKVVDASYFGDAFPKGWRLSLSIKKKSGRVWLFCRRYISPSGLQFESCKEVATYLLSLLGEEHLDKPTHTPSNNCDDFASKGASVKKDVSVRVDTRRSRPVVLALSSSLPRVFKKEVKSNIVDPIDVQVEEVYKCLKCFMIFEGKVDLFDHQVLSHKTERSQLDSAISEWTVVKGGIFECQFCNKTFNERNQYNEHIGTHGTNEIKTCEASEAPTAETTVDPVLFTGVPDNVVMETDDKLISASPQTDHKISSGTKSEVNEHVHDLNILDHDNQGEHVNMNDDVSLEESGGEIEKETDDAAFGDKLISDHKISSGSESEFNDDVHDLKMNKDVLVEESGGEIEKKCNQGDNEVSERYKSPDVSDSKSDFSLGHEASMSVDESNGKLESCVVTVDCVDDKCNKGLDDSSDIVEKDIVPETGATHVDETPECILEKGKSCENSPLLPSTNELLGNVEKNVVGEEKVFQENMNDSHICSSFDDLTSEKEKVMNEEVNKLLDSETLALDSPQKLGFASSASVVVDDVSHDFEENRFCYGIANSRVDGQQHEFRSSVIEKEDIGSKVEEPQSQTQMDLDDFDLENNDVNNACSNRSTEVNLDELQVFKNHDEINELNLNTGVMGFDTGENNLEFCSLVNPTVNEQEFRFQNDDENDASGLNLMYDHFSIPETYDDLFDDEDNTGGGGGIGIHDDLNLAFGKKDPLPSNDNNNKIEDTFDVQTDLSMVNNNETRAFSDSHNANIVYQQPQNGNGGFRVDDGFGFSLNGFNRSSGTSSRSAPVEFRFLSQHNNHLQGGSTSGVFPYNNTNNNNPLQQGFGFGSGFWSGKNVNGMVGNMGITGVCVWCRNEFHMQPEIQGGGVGSLCPNCSGQVNML